MIETAEGEVIDMGARRAVMLDDGRWFWIEAVVVDGRRVRVRFNADDQFAWVIA